jgi:hypothetical protein
MLRGRSGALAGHGCAEIVVGDPGGPRAIAATGIGSVLQV